MPFSRVFLERVDLISSTTVEGALYGFTFSLYIFCARALYLQLNDRDRRRQHLFTLLYMSLLMALALCELAMDAQMKQSSYVEHADYRNGAFGYYVEVVEESPIGNASNAVGILFSLMIYGIQIWRLWIVWSATRYALFVVVLPVLALLTNIVLQVVDSVILARSAWSPRLSGVVNNTLTATPLCISAIVTGAIIGRILMVRRMHLRVTGQTDTSSPYTSVISMLIESFALECVWMVVQLSLFNASTRVGNILGLFFTNTEFYIQLLAYLLVVHRVSTNRGWERDTGEKLTTLQWNQNRLQTTQIGTRPFTPTTREEA